MTQNAVSPKPSGKVLKMQNAQPAKADPYANMSVEELKAALAKEKEINQKLTAGGPISFKVSEKGAVSVYGLGRFPVTLYREQWEKLFANMPGLKKFIEENKVALDKAAEGKAARKAENAAKRQEEQDGDEE